MPSACARSSPLRCRPASASGGHGSVIECRSSRKSVRRRAAAARAHARARAMSRAVEHLGGPQAVEILVDAARCERIGRRRSAGTRRRWRRRASACRASAGSRSRSSQSSAIAPHTSLPCVSAWISDVRARRGGVERARRTGCRYCPRAQRDRGPGQRDVASAGQRAGGVRALTQRRGVGEPSHERFAARELVERSPTRSAGAPARCGPGRR